MTTEDQTAAIDFLMSPSAHGGAAVERVDTHTAIVFLAGQLAWKLKRAVRFDYLDFSTVERRKAMCEAELHLNRRTAPAIYREVSSLTRQSDGSISLNGRGIPIDWVVCMNRFDQDLLFDRLAERHELQLALMAPLASFIVSFHAGAEHRPDHGGRAGMQWVVDGNESGLTEFGAHVFDTPTRASFTNAARAELTRRADELDARRRAGFVRQCHGDLHLRNVVLLDGRPTLFDAVEFNDEISCIDVLYDLAFLLMDLWRRGLPTHANTVLNAYLAESRDWNGLSLLPLFLSCRAAVRAKTGATSATMQADSTAASQLQQAARDYLEMADLILHREPPCVVAVGGFSGSGKSTLARGLAPLLGRIPGAVVLRTDEIRKEVCRVAPLEHLGAEGYLPQVSRTVYATIGRRAGAVARAQHTVIVDGVFANAEERAAIESVAADAAVPFAGLWLDASLSTLSDRVRRRERDASDATAEVVHMQTAKGAGTINWQRIDASGNVEFILDRARLCLSRDGIATREV